MPEIFVGEVAVGVVPSARGFHEKLRQQVVPSANRIGQEMGQHVTRGITERLDVGKAAVEASRRGAGDTARAGETSGTLYGRAFRTRLQAMLHDVHVNVKMDVDDRQVRKLRNEADESAGIFSRIGSNLRAITGFNPQLSTFGKIWAGINLATGYLEPALAGLTVGILGFANGIAAAAIGTAAFGVVASSVFSQSADAAKKVQQAQDQFTSATASTQVSYENTVAKAQDTYARAMASATTKTQISQAKATLATSLHTAAVNKQAAEHTALQTKLQATKQAYDGLSPSQIDLAKSIGTVKEQWKDFVRSVSPDIVPVFKDAFGLLPSIFATLRPFLPPVAAALRAIIADIRQGLVSPEFRAHVQQLARETGPMIVRTYVIVKNIVQGIMGLFRAFAPEQDKVSMGIVHLSERFRDWGKSMGPSHTGFQTMMDMFHKDGPIVVEILKNLAATIGNVGSAMFGLTGVGNSALFLQFFRDFTGLLRMLSENPWLTRILLYTLMFKSGLDRLTPAIRTAVDVGKGMTNLGRGFADATVAASASSGAMGTLGGRLRTVAGGVGSLVTGMIHWGGWQKIVTAGQWLLNAAMSANPVMLIVIAIAAVVTAFVILWTRSAAFRNFWIGLWNGILGIVKGVWNWISHNWPLLLAILTGPVGLAVLAIRNHMGTITSASKNTFSGVQRAASASWDSVGNAFKWMWEHVLRPAVSAMWNMISGVFGFIINGAAKAFGWIPGIGGKLRGAATEFNRFRDNVNNAINGVQGKKVTVSVAMTSATNPYPGGISGRAASGGRIFGPGGPRDDLIPLLASNGEYIHPADAVDYYGLPMMEAIRTRQFPKFAGGGEVTIAPSVPSPGFISNSINSQITGLAKQWANQFFSSMAVTGVSKSAEAWAPIILVALSLLHQSPSWLGVVERRLDQESGGNSTIVNKWDSNWARGTPSVGLMQVIGPTYAAYAGPFRGIGPFLYGVSVSPLANIYAGLNYALHAYGSLAALSRPGGYARGGPVRGGDGAALAPLVLDDGGWIPPGASMVYNFTGRDELAVPYDGLASGAGGAIVGTNAMLRKMDHLIAAVERQAAEFGAVIDGTARLSAYRGAR